MECTCQGNDFELIPMVEMETRNPVEGYFGSEFQNSVRDTNFVKYGRHEISEIVHCLPDKKKTKFRLALQLSLLHGSCQKSARASSHQCTQSAPDFIQICSLLA